MNKRLLVRDQRGERERLLVGTMTVGRDTRCDISDADPLLSRRHAEFVCRPDSLVVRDLNSRNGVSVNGVKVQEAVLRPGDVVKVARLVMTYLGDLDSVRSAPSRTAAGEGRAGTREAAAAPPAQAPLAPTRLAAPSSELAPPEPPEADSDSTRPMIHDSEIRTATPVLPLSALAASGAAQARPPAPPPPIAAAPTPVAPAPPVLSPPAADPLEDWSLELRPPQPDRPPPPAEAPPRVSAQAGAEASRLAAARSPLSSVRAPAGSLVLALVAFLLGAMPLLVWRGRIAETSDRLLIVPTAITPGMAIALFGPPLLVALAAAIALAWWLRRG
jgi:predicted component of type VI protein secretion system